MSDSVLTLEKLLRVRELLMEGQRFNAARLNRIFDAEVLPYIRRPMNDDTPQQEDTRPRLLYRGYTITQVGTHWPTGAFTTLADLDELIERRLRDNYYNRNVWVHPSDFAMLRTAMMSHNHLPERRPRYEPANEPGIHPWDSELMEYGMLRDLPAALLGRARRPSIETFNRIMVRTGESVFLPNLIRSLADMIDAQEAFQSFDCEQQWLWEALRDVTTRGNTERVALASIISLEARTLLVQSEMLRNRTGRLPRLATWIPRFLEVRAAPEIPLSDAAVEMELDIRREYLFVGFAPPDSGADRVMGFNTGAVWMDEPLENQTLRMDPEATAKVAVTEPKQPPKPMAWDELFKT